MIHRNSELETHINDKAETINGYRAYIKGLATRFMVCGSPDVVYSTFSKAQEFGYIPQMEVTMVWIGNGYLFFDGMTPPQVREMMERVKAPIKKATSSAVLQKMLAGRIREIHNLVEQENGFIARRNEWNNKNEAMMAYPEFRTIQSIRDYFLPYETSPVVSPFHHSMKMFRKRIEREVLSKPEVTDDDVSRATDMLIVNAVMAE